MKRRSRFRLDHLRDNLAFNLAPGTRPLRTAASIA
jgi:hypothetical protein